MSLFKLTAFGFAAALVYYVFPRRMRWIILLLASYTFYATRALSALPFILITTVTTWLAALTIGKIGDASKTRLKAEKDSLSAQEKKIMKTQAKSRQRVLMLSALVLNFVILGVLKYTDEVLRMVGSEPLGLLLPLGISFYTFQSMGYLIDVYNGKYPPERNVFRFALYVSFFPQLIQGPIGRYDQLAPQLAKAQDFDVKNLESGAMLVLWGLFKKLVIADRALPVVNAVFSAQAGEYGGAVIVLGVLMYSLQQYCDFSGGIELVTGIAQWFGVQLAPNFKRPYFAVSLGDFWRRWHISLGSWMRDYVFYPFALTKPVSRLSRAAKARFGADFARALPAALGNVLVFVLVGVWHGAASNYILWGLYNGLVLAASALLEPAYKRFATDRPQLVASKGFHVFRVLRTFVIVNIGWYFDRCMSGMQAIRMLGTTIVDPRFAQLNMEVMTSLGAAAADYVLLALCTVLLFSVSVCQERGKIMRDWVMARPLPLRWAIQISAIVAVLIFGVYGSGFDEAAFIYYQF